MSEAVALNVAVLTLSDTRTLAEDRSGDTLVQLLQAAGHQLVARDLIPDDVYRMRAVVSQWIADPSIQVILTTGGTGFSGRDSTPEALRPLFDTEIEGFGETFRQVSWEEIGSSTIQSRALAGLANRTAIFCLPGSTGACKTAWNRILLEQLDSRHRPCNFVGILLHGKQLHS
ncbi:MAG: molybdenum cofactor biosynthesis protein B [Nitrincola lacisaponensis]|uniref:Molybdenum cofactor biosynthesis protein B n=1 Tax=Nitrincola lacisaponensis TaxID=267850 RepID=A0A063Y1Q7_9GAMM|nr:molybdenum cofactor biosynthesis protein B [Nitrincola lacisaponensis]KDE39080.1 Molybdenum cofactor biosynthesis protein MoaB [Nitrincola lacisaponensis]